MHFKYNICYINNYVRRCFRYEYDITNSRLEKLKNFQTAQCPAQIPLNWMWTCALYTVAEDPYRFIANYMCVHSSICSDSHGSVVVTVYMSFTCWRTIWRHVMYNIYQRTMLYSSQ